MPLPLSPYERPSLGAAQLLMGRPGSALRALVAPTSLSPDQLQDVPQLLGLPEGGEGPVGGLWDAIKDTVTNPLFLVALAMGLKFPAAGLKHLGKFRSDLVGYAKSLGPILGRVSSVATQFGNTGIPRLSMQLGDEVVGLKGQWAEEMGAAIQRFNQAAGRKAGSLPTRAERARVALALEGLGDPNSEASKWFRGQFRDVVKDKAAEVVRFGEQGETLLRPEFARSLSRAEQGLVSDLRGLLGKIWNTTLNFEAQPTLIKVMAKKGMRFKKTGTVAEARQLLQQRGVKVGPAGPKDSWESLVSDVLRSGNDELSTAVLDVVKGDRKQVMRALEEAGVLGEIPLIGDYFPHLSQWDETVFDQMSRSMLEAAGYKQDVYSAQQLAGASRRISPSSQARQGVMVPDPDDLALPGVAEYLNPRAVEAIRAKQGRHVETQMGRISELAGLEDEKALFQKIGQVVKGIGGVPEDKAGAVTNQLIEVYRERGKDSLMRAVGDLAQSANAFNRYSLDALDVVGRYSHTMATQHVWTTKGLGAQMRGEIEKITDDGLRSVMLNEVMPILMGKGTYQQNVKAVAWSNWKLDQMARVKDGTGFWGLVPEGVRTKLHGWLVNTVGPTSYKGMQRKLAGYFYLSTLGANPASAFKNLLQTVLTTYPLLGSGRSLLAGLRESNRRMAGYFGDRLKGVGADEAFYKNFKEMVDAGLDPHPIHEQLRQSFAEDAFQQLAANKPMMQAFRSGKQKLSDLAMGLFTHSERFNRSVAFYGAHHQATREGMRGPEAMQVAREFVHATQFPGGPLQTPAMIRSWGPLTRQFLHFPMRYMEFLGSSLYRPYGPEGKFAQPTWWNPMGWNLGTVGRTVAGSVAAYNVGKEVLGMDLSGGLMTGALPLPAFEGSPFYPLPIVPPAVSIAGSGAMALAQGSLDPMKQAWPLMVPGGVMLNRLRKNWSPEFADYENRTPDGRIPLYSAKGSLIGFKTPMQLVGKSLGFGDITATQEQTLMEYLIKQRDKIRLYRKEYLEAVAGNNMNEAEAIETDYMADYPGAGKIHFRPQDLDAVKMRGEITRLEKMLDTIPQEARPQFAQVVSAALASRTEQLLGVDPILLQAPGMSARTRRKPQQLRSRAMLPPGAGGGGRGEPSTDPLNQTFGGMSFTSF